MRNKTIFAVLLLLPLNGYAVSMLGAVPCDKWVKDSQKNGWAKVANTAWIAGYLAGIAESTGKNYLAGTSLEYLEAGVDSYCLDHPRKDVVDAIWQQ